MTPHFYFKGINCLASFIISSSLFYSSAFTILQFLLLLFLTLYFFQVQPFLTWWQYFIPVFPHSFLLLCRTNFNDGTHGRGCFTDFFSLAGTKLLATLSSDRKWHPPHFLTVHIQGTAKTQTAMVPVKGEVVENCSWPKICFGLWGKKYSIMSSVSDKTFPMTVCKHEKKVKVNRMYFICW